MRVLLPACLLLLGSVSLLSAEPLDRSQVSADARWLAHVDFDAVKTVKTGQWIRDDWLKRDATKQGLNKLRDTIGLDPAKDLHGITFYGSRISGEAGVVILRAKLDRRRLLAELKKKLDHQSSAYGDHELHLLTQAKGKGGKRTMTGCFYRPAVLVFGRDPAEVKLALDVLDGKAPNLAGGDPPFDVDARGGTVFEARATGLDGDDVPFKSPILRQSDSIRVALGEQQEGRMFLDIELVAKSAEVAGQMRSIVEGLLAMVRLQCGSDEKALAVLEAFRVATADRTVTVAWQGPGDEVLKLIEKEWEKMAKAKRVD